MKKIVTLLVVLLSLFTNLTVAAFASEGDPQTTIDLHGTIVDEQNAYIPAVPITLDDGQGHHYSVTSDASGHYHVLVVPGTYTVAVALDGFAKFSQQLDLTQKRTAPFDIK